MFSPFYTKIVKQTANNLNIDPSIVESVIMFKNKELYKALGKHTSIEDSYFGNFNIRSRYVINNLEKFKNYFFKTFTSCINHKNPKENFENVKKFIITRLDQYEYMESLIDYDFLKKILKNEY